jgi:SpoVK/Ycf46/Vps4 family AAA+-type ATPase
MEIIKDWIINSYINNERLSLNSCIFIYGNSGIGKSYTINKIANELDLFLININSFNCNSSSILVDILYKSYVSSLIQILTNNKQKKIIIIDDFDILMAIDNTINISLYNFIVNNTNKLKHIPIICILNNDLIKKIGDIKKKCKLMEFPKMTDKEIHNILQTYKNNLTLDETKKIIKETNHNLSSAIKILTNTNYNKIDDIINIDDLYGEEFNRNKFKKIILKELWIIPLNFHENLINELLNNRNGNKKNCNEFYKSFIKNFCYFDIFMYKNNEIGIDFFISIIYNLYKFKLKKKTISNNKSFTKMLSYLSLQKKNNKNSYKNSFPFSQIGNFHISCINKKYYV